MFSRGINLPGQESEAVHIEKSIRPDFLEVKVAIGALEN
jgi:hypothetical protein